MNVCTKEARVPVYIDDEHFTLVVRRVTVERRAAITELMDELGAAGEKAEATGAELPESLPKRAEKELRHLVAGVEDFKMDGRPVETLAALEKAVRDAWPGDWPALFWAVWAAAVGAQFAGGPLSRASAYSPATSTGGRSGGAAPAPAVPPPAAATKPAPTQATGTP